MGERSTRDRWRMMGLMGLLRGQLRVENYDAAVVTLEGLRELVGAGLPGGRVEASNDRMPSTGEPVHGVVGPDVQSH